MTGPLMAIVWGGAACGILDGAAASAQFALKGIAPVRVWQGVASGLLGERAFEKGWLSVGLGFVLHFVISFIVAAVFVEGCRRMPFLGETFWISGPLYGVLVFLVMNLVVVPLSARPKRPASVQLIAIQVVIHMVFVGLPIAMAAKRFLF